MDVRGLGHAAGYIPDACQTPDDQQDADDDQQTAGSTTWKTGRARPLGTVPWQESEPGPPSLIGDGEPRLYRSLEKPKFPCLTRQPGRFAVVGVSGFLASQQLATGGDTGENPPAEAVLLAVSCSWR